MLRVCSRVQAGHSQVSLPPSVVRVQTNAAAALFGCSRPHARQLVGSTAANVAPGPDRQDRLHRSRTVWAGRPTRRDFCAVT